MKKDREGEEKGKRRGFTSILGPPRRPSRHDNSASMLKSAMPHSHHSVPSSYQRLIQLGGVAGEGCSRNVSTEPPLFLFSVISNGTPGIQLDFTVVISA